MHKKLNSRGITLLELIIAVSLLTIVLSSAYFLLSFCQKALSQTEAQFDAGQDARIAIMEIEQDIRKAQAVKIDTTRYKAVDVDLGGMQINIYTDVGNDGSIQLVQYKLDGEKLVRGEADLEIIPMVIPTIAPTASYTVVDTVKNGMSATPVPIFSVDDDEIKVELLVLDEEERILDNPITVKTSITVRSKGAMD